MQKSAKLKKMYARKKETPCPGVAQFLRSIDEDVNAYCVVCIGNAEVNEVNGQPGLFGISSSISMQRSEWIHRSEGEPVDCILSYHVFLFKFFSFDVKLFQGQKNSRHHLRG